MRRKFSMSIIRKRISLSLFYDFFFLLLFPSKEFRPNQKTIAERGENKLASIFIFIDFISRRRFNARTIFPKNKLNWPKRGKKIYLGENMGNRCYFMIQVFTIVLQKHKLFWNLKISITLNYFQNILNKFSLKPIGISLQQRCLL